MANEIVDLPERKAPAAAVPAAQPGQPAAKRGLTERQMDMAIEGTVQVLGGAVSIARDLIDIARIRTQAAADVARIEAQTRDVVERMKVEVEKISAEGDNVLKRGQAAAAVIEAALKFIPESDTAARALAIDTLKTLVVAATGGGEKPDRA